MIYTIAEISANHGQNLDRALRLVDAAAAAGFSAIKLQTYTPDTMTKPGLYKIERGAWAGRDLYELYQEGALPLAWHAPIFRQARARGIDFFSTPFHPQFVPFLENLGVSRYKIASFEITYLDLIEACARTGKPIIISTGMANLSEIETAYTVAEEAGCTDITLLRCTSSYPAKPEDANLSSLRVLRETFPRARIGFSDHTLGNTIGVAALALGARVFEKHITIAADDTTLDASFALTIPELHSYINSLHMAAAAIGNPVFGPASQDEIASLLFRRSVYNGNEILRPAHLGRDLNDYYTQTKK
jgi:N-acetylneuraminate synthase